MNGRSVPKKEEAKKEEAKGGAKGGGKGSGKRRGGRHRSKSQDGGTAEKAAQQERFGMMQGTQGETSKSSGLFTEAGEWVPKEVCQAIEEVSSISERLMHMREPDRVPNTVSIPKLLLSPANCFHKLGCMGIDESTCTYLQSNLGSHQHMSQD